MKAQKVFENIEFKRGQGITKSVGLGIYAPIERPRNWEDFDLSQIPAGIYVATSDLFKRSVLLYINPTKFKHFYMIGPWSKQNVPFDKEEALEKAATTVPQKKSLTWLNMSEISRLQLFQLRNDLKFLGLEAELNENQEFKRGGDRNIHQKLGVGWERKVEDMLAQWADDYQFNPDDSGFHGYLNVGDDFMSPSIIPIYRYYVDHWRKFNNYLESLGLEVLDDPTYGETIFHQTPNHKWWKED